MRPIYIYKLYKKTPQAWLTTATFHAHQSFLQVLALLGCLGNPHDLPMVPTHSARQLGPPMVRFKRSWSLNWGNSFPKASATLRIEEKLTRSPAIPESKNLKDSDVVKGGGWNQVVVQISRDYEALKAMSRTTLKEKMVDLWFPWNQFGVWGISMSKWPAVLYNSAKQTMDHWVCHGDFNIRNLQSKICLTCQSIVLISGSLWYTLWPHISIWIICGSASQPDSSPLPCDKFPKPWMHLRIVCVTLLKGFQAVPLTDGSKMSTG